VHCAGLSFAAGGGVGFGGIGATVGFGGCVAVAGEPPNNFFQKLM